MSQWSVALLLAGLLGLGTGIGSYTFIYARGYSYLTNDPSACANCHIMSEQYDGWIKSSHRAVAACNDCHTPPALLPRYFTKASNGFWHSFAFTTGLFHEPLRIKPANLEVTERACRACHEDIVQAIDHPVGGQGELSCVRCHRDAGHLH